MDPVKIPEDQIVPMDAVAPGVKGLRITFVNVLASRILTVRGRSSMRPSPFLPG